MPQVSTQAQIEAIKRVLPTVGNKRSYALKNKLITLIRERERHIKQISYQNWLAQ